MFDVHLLELQTLALPLIVAVPKSGYLLHRFLIFVYNNLFVAGAWVARFCFEGLSSKAAKLLGIYLTIDKDQ